MSSSNWFDEMMRRQAANIREDVAYPTIDWDEHREWWLKRVDQLLGDIVQWVQPLIDENILQATRKRLEIHEEYLGDYVTESLTLEIEKVPFEVVPVACVVANAFGVVDLIGKSGSAKLALCAPDDTLTTRERRDSSRWYWMHAGSGEKWIEMSEWTFKELYANLMGFNQ